MGEIFISLNVSQLSAAPWLACVWVGCFFIFSGGGWVGIGLCCCHWKMSLSMRQMCQRLETKFHFGLYSLQGLHVFEEILHVLPSFHPLMQQFNGRKAVKLFSWYYLVFIDANRFLFLLSLSFMYSNTYLIFSYWPQSTGKKWKGLVCGIS